MLLAQSPQVTPKIPVTVDQAKNLPNGAQFVTLMKPGASHGITVTPGSALPVNGMTEMVNVKFIPQTSIGG